VGVFFTHGQERNQFPKVDRAFSLLGLWHRRFTAGASLCSFRLAHSVKMVNTLRISDDGDKPCQPLGFSLHLRNTTVIIVGGIIADRI
jgi:hypothetical protein